MVPDGWTDGLTGRTKGRHKILLRRGGGGGGGGGGDENTDPSQPVPLFRLFTSECVEHQSSLDQVALGDTFSSVNCSCV